MGFFSWNCRGCEHPLLSRWATNGENGWMQQAVVVEAEGRVLEGTYDGYGRVGGQEINRQHSRTDTEYKEPGCWHRACWVKAGKPTDYAPSKSSDCQGYFCGECQHDMNEPSCPPMGTDGGPCGHCDKPVWYCNDEEQWFHEDPDHQCFLSRGKAKPTAPEVKTWTVHVQRPVIMVATFSVEAESRDAAYDLAEERAIYGDLNWEDNDPTGGRATVEDVEEEA